jgi:hypothetical protein
MIVLLLPQNKCYEFLHANVSPVKFCFAKTEPSGNLYYCITVEFYRGKSSAVEVGVPASGSP